jgi:four helix bundle protein
MAPARTFRDLLIWQKAFVLCVYRETERFPRDERFGLTSQLRRSAVSIAANIAEGFVKRGVADKLRFLNIAQGSLEESRYLILASDLGITDLASAGELVDECGRMIEASCNTLRRSSSPLVAAHGAAPQALVEANNVPSG